MQKLIHTFHYAKELPNPAVTVSLDAFDQINWKYLFRTPEEFGLGQNIINYISVLYSNPIAKVSTNGMISEGFPLYRGTRQGFLIVCFVFRTISLSDAL